MQEPPLRWLMEGDPAIRYHTSRDLLDAPKDDIRHHQMYIEIDGWGKDILDQQDDRGTWQNSLWEPKYTSTLWVLTTLRKMGLERDNIQAKLGASLLLEDGMRGDGGINYKNENEPGLVCISSLVLAAASYFRVTSSKRDAIFEFLIESQMDDKGWHCQWHAGAKHSSLQTTLLVLEALREYSRANKNNLSLNKDLQTEASELLLSHNLLYADPIKKITNLEILDFTFPPQEHYDLLTALDYFQSVNHPYDERFTKVIGIVSEKEIDGYWHLERVHQGIQPIKMEDLGKPSRWITLRVLRVMRWWDKVSKYKR